MIIPKDVHDNAVEYVQENYVTVNGHEALLLGNVAELIEKLTGRRVDWQQLAKHGGHGNLKPKYEIHTRTV